MKVDKSLEEVWCWKDAVYEDTKKMTWKERRLYSQKVRKELEKKYGFKLQARSK